MRGQTIILHGPSQREYARKLIDSAPKGAVVNIREGKRTTAQNDKVWALLSDISRAQPEGRKHTTEVWKCIFMNALEHKTKFEKGLDGEVFPIGFSTSRLTVKQMSDLIEFIYWYGAQHNVQWSEPEAA